MADMSNKEEEEGKLHLMIPTDIPTHKQTKTVMPHSVEKVLSIYQVVFEEPKALPPKRAIDHAIPGWNQTQPSSSLLNGNHFFRIEVEPFATRETADS